MALSDKLSEVNSILTFLERVINLNDRSIITAPMFDEMKRQVIAYLETVFPQPPPT